MSDEQIIEQAPAMLRAEGVIAGYGGIPVLKGVDFEILPGELVGLIGGNGAGKSTLLRVLAGELPVNEGRVEVGTLQTQGRPRLFRLAQEPELPGFLNLEEIVTLAIRAWRQDIPSPADLARELLVRWGLEGRVDRPIRVASPGEVRRTLLAVVDAVRPGVLLLDEVLSALDPRVLPQAEDLVDSLAAEGGVTVLVTHDMGLAERVPSKILLLDSGRIAAQWTREWIAEERSKGRTLYDLFLEHTAS